MLSCSDGEMQGNREHVKSRANIVVGLAIAAVVVAALGGYAFVQAGTGAGAAAKGAWRVVVHDGDGGVHEMALSEDRELVVETSLGTNVVAVEGGSVYVREADCDNRDCMRQGTLSAPGRQIICLPHKLWIEVVADGGDSAADMDVDAVADFGSNGGLDAVAR